MHLSLKINQALPVDIVISMLGYKTQELNITSASQSLEISMEEEAVLSDEVVVTASRVEESYLKSPVAIEKLDLRAIQESPKGSFYDALENVKGVQMTTSSLTFKVPNTRGFNIPNNFRFMQLVDGVDMQSATLGVPLGNAIGPTELDIESVEITPGAASALYGLNAINGMANMKTKDPFTFQGLSVYGKTGINHVNTFGGQDPLDPRSNTPLGEAAIRYAKAINNRLAFKVNGSYFKGTDWTSTNTTDQNASSFGTGVNNPQYDAWNKYGDESNNQVSVIGVDPVTNKQTTYNVRRTGYNETALTLPQAKNIKLDGSLHYRINEKLEASYSYRYGLMDGVFQRGNKIQLHNATVQNHKVELKGKDFFYPWLCIS